MTGSTDLCLFSCTQTVPRLARHMGHHSMILLSQNLFRCNPHKNPLMNNECWGDDSKINLTGSPGHQLVKPKGVPSDQTKSSQPEQDLRPPSQVLCPELSWARNWFSLSEWTEAKSAWWYEMEKQIFDSLTLDLFSQAMFPCSVPSYRPIIKIFVTFSFQLAPPSWAAPGCHETCCRCCSCWRFCCCCRRCSRWIYYCRCRCCSCWRCCCVRKIIVN